MDGKKAADKQELLLLFNKRNLVASKEFNKRKEKPEKMKNQELNS